jgi:hypothetical protein
LKSLAKMKQSASGRERVERGVYDARRGWQQAGLGSSLIGDGFQNVRGEVTVAAVMPPSLPIVNGRYQLRRTVTCIRDNLMNVPASNEMRPWLCHGSFLLRYRCVIGSITWYHIPSLPGLRQRAREVLWLNPICACAGESEAVERS